MWLVHMNPDVAWKRVFLPGRVLREFIDIAPTDLCSVGDSPCNVSGRVDTTAVYAGFPGSVAYRYWPCFDRRYYGVLAAGIARALYSVTATAEWIQALPGFSDLLA